MNEDSRDSHGVLIAIPTFRRPEMLERLLCGIAGISAPDGCAVEVLVLDNDSTPQARGQVLRIAESFPFRLSYAHVGTPGLSAVRNFALRRARHYDYLAMIDDDEIPQRQWLLELMKVQDATGADAVIGPVPRVMPGAAPLWLRRARLFDSPMYPDRTLVRDGHSGNCLLRIPSIRRLGITFDSTFNFAGGEDLLFFRELARRGGVLAFAAGAVAEETVSADRVTVSYILKLHFRRGNTLSRCDLYFDKGWATVAARALKGVGLVARGCARLLPNSFFRGRAGSVTSLCEVARGFGELCGIFGYTYQAYARPDKAYLGEAGGETEAVA
jgi:succinoglycan biosynthesis protein ExoM